MSTHELTQREQDISREASARLGFPVQVFLDEVFLDGEWICQPRHPLTMGFGGTPEAAIRHCREQNTPLEA